MQVANFGTKHGGGWAPSWRNLSDSFVYSKQKTQEAIADYVDLSLICRSPSTVAETNLNPKPFVWTADPKRVLECKAPISFIGGVALGLVERGTPDHLGPSDSAVGACQLD